jgi:hypothetical protein
VSGRSEPWQIAADLETAAKAVEDASRLLDAIHISALREVEEIPGMDHLNRDMAKAIMAISDRYQAISDAEMEA